jgi:hypothetical protein
MTLDQQLETDLDHELSLDRAKVLPFVRPPLDEIERAADIHRRAIATYEHRKGEAIKRRKAVLVAVQAERRRLAAAYKADMVRLDEQADDARAAGERETAIADRLAAANRAALDALAEL